MSLYKFAPREVIHSLSSKAQQVLENRIINNELKPYLPLANNLRIRGLKPSILYTKYTSLHEDNSLNTMYVTSAEEHQCEWVLSVKKQKLNKMQAIDIFLAAMTEMSWCTWEDNIMNGIFTIPQSHLHGYRDLINNTFTHCIAYACTNKRPIDTGEIEAQFQALDFINNTDMFAVNDIGATPLKILLESEELRELVESFLLRLPQENRLKALSFPFWDKSWGSLMNLTVMGQLPLLIEQTTKLEGFLSIYFNLTHNDEEAFRKLFHQGYKLQRCHFYMDNLSIEQKRILKTTTLEIPSWHNLTFWIHVIIINTDPQTNFKKIRHHLEIRISIIKQEIALFTMHVDYLKKMNSNYNFISQ